MPMVATLMTEVACAIDNGSDILPIVGISVTVTTMGIVRYGHIFLWGLPGEW